MSFTIGPVTVATLSATSRSGSLRVVLYTESIVGEIITTCIDIIILPRAVVKTLALDGYHLS